MGGLTDWYCYSLWGLALRTNRRLWRWCCQQRWSGYLHTQSKLECNPTGTDALCPLGSSECHNMEIEEREGIVRGGFLQSMRHYDPPNHILHSYNLPLRCSESRDFLHSHAIETEAVHMRVQVLRPSKPLLFHFWETDPLLMHYPSQPLKPTNFPVSPPLHNQELSEPSSDHRTLTRKHALWPVFCPKCPFFTLSPVKQIRWHFLVQLLACWSAAGGGRANKTKAGWIVETLVIILFPMLLG